MALEPGSKRNSISDIAPISPITILKGNKKTLLLLSPCFARVLRLEQPLELSSAMEKGESRVVHVVLK